MKKRNVELMSHLPKEVVANIPGIRLNAFLIALEGWRRGLSLKWYKDETTVCKLATRGGSTRGRFFSLSSDQQTHYFLSSRGDKVSNKSVYICQDKEETKRIIEEKCVPVTKGKTFDLNDDYIIEYAVTIGFPVVIKPAKGSMGRGVYTNIKTVESLKNAIEDFKLRQKYKSIIMEKHYFGNEYRMYVVGNKVIAATNRVPANIEGDGTHTIEELINLKNEERKNNPYLKSKPIQVDYEIKLTLNENALTLRSVLNEGEILSLRKVSNLSAGGDPLDATDELTDEVKQIAIDGVNALPSIPHAGIDIIVNPEDNKQGVILEVNATAEIAFHMYPWAGKGRDVPKAIIDYYFPETIGLEKSSWYFDSHSVLEPLKTWSTDEITMASAPDLLRQLYAKKFIVSGKVIKTGFMTYIRKQALKRDMQGFTQKHGRKSIEVVVIGKNKEDIDNFRKVCYRGSKKSNIKSIEEYDITLENQTFKLGFEIITNK